MPEVCLEVYNKSNVSLFFVSTDERKERYILNELYDWFYEGGTDMYEIIYKGNKTVLRRKFIAKVSLWERNSNS
jgi:hypothetical protein